MAAHHFILASLETGAMVGQALVCVEARYASIRWKHTPRLDRRFVEARRWRELEREIREGWSMGLVPPDSALYVALVPEDQERGVQVQLMASLPIETGDPLTAAQTLDRYLTEQPFA